jgi:hypothetical protein
VGDKNASETTCIRVAEILQDGGLYTGDIVVIVVYFIGMMGPSDVVLICYI